MCDVRGEKGGRWGVNQRGISPTKKAMHKQHQTYRIYAPYKYPRPSEVGEDLDRPNLMVVPKMVVLEYAHTTEPSRVFTANSPALVPVKGENWASASSPGVTCVGVARG